MSVLFHKNGKMRYEMNDLKYTSLIEQEYESISEDINIIGIRDNSILGIENYLTADLWGNRILRIINIDELEKMELPKRLINPEYGNIDLNIYLQNTITTLRTIDEVRKITDKLPSLTTILLKDRHDE